MCCGLTGKNQAWGSKEPVYHGNSHDLCKRNDQKSLRGDDLAAEWLLAGGIARAAHLGVSMATSALAKQ
jgi:hypothetical protein|eukprot:1084080-Prymnesium_polylepis.1